MSASPAPSSRYPGLAVSPPPSVWGLSTEISAPIASHIPVPPPRPPSSLPDLTHTSSSATPSRASTPASGPAGLTPSNSLRRRARASDPHTTSPVPVPISASPANGSHPLATGYGSSPEAGPSDVSRPTLLRLTSETERRLEDAGLSSAREGREGSERGPGSARGKRSSEDKARRSDEAGEVEVLIHQASWVSSWVKANESLAGVALLYGIDLATLRKTNKLWPSDPVHLRTHLYVPLEACRWNKASEVLVRGPGEGQVTLTAKAGHGSVRGDGALSDRDQHGPGAKGKGKERAGSGGEGWSGHRRSATDGDLAGRSNMEMDLELGVGVDSGSWENEYDEWADSPSKPNASGGTSYPVEVRRSDSKDSADDKDGVVHNSHDAEESTGPPRTGVRVLDVVRIPASQLRFFPRAQRPESSRSSFESDLRRTSLTLTRRATVASSSTSARSRQPSESGPEIHHDLTTLPAALQPEPVTSHKSTTVRIRPPTNAPTPGSGSGGKGNGLANRLSALFVVPPPPIPGDPLLPPRKPRPRVSLDSARSSGLSSPRRSRRSSVASSPRQGGSVIDELEMQVQSRGSMETLKDSRPNGNGRLLVDLDEGKKLD